MITGVRFFRWNNRTNFRKYIDKDKAKYDASVKEVLADKQILARILKYTLEEFADDRIEQIIQEMDEPYVSKVRMEPGQTNLNKIERNSEEDKNGSL